MAVREFTDPSGRMWRAWEIKPSSRLRQIDRQSFDRHQLGWIVFQTPDASEKRRLPHPYPPEWAQLSDLDLVALLTNAVPATASRLARGGRSTTTPPLFDAPAGGHATSPTPGVPSAHRTGDEPRVVRSFRFPGGRLWSVYVAAHPRGGGPPVLRFAAGARTVDLKEWPPDWAVSSPDGLAALLRQAQRPPGKRPAPGTPRRRHGDRLR